MGNCSACLSRGYSIHDMALVEEEKIEFGGNDQVDDIGLKSSAVTKVLTVTDGEVLECEAANKGNNMRAHHDRGPRHTDSVLRAKDVISRVQRADSEYGGSYGLFEGRRDSGHDYDNFEKTNESHRISEALHPETPLEQNRVYYLGPWRATGAAAPANNSGAANNNSGAAMKYTADAEAPRAAAGKKVRFSDDVVFIPSSSSSGPRLPEDADDHDDPSNRVNHAAARRPVVRVKVLLSKRQLHGLLASSQNSAAANSLLVDRLVNPLLPPHLAQQLHIAAASTPAQHDHPSLLSQLQQATRHHINQHIET